MMIINYFKCQKHDIIDHADLYFNFVLSVEKKLIIFMQLETVNQRPLRTQSAFIELRSGLVKGRDTKTSKSKSIATIPTACQCPSTMCSCSWPNSAKMD